MLRTTIWRDLRWRLPAVAALVALALAVLLIGLLGDSGRAARADLLRYLDDAWFQLPGGGAVWMLVVLILAASGSLVRPRRDVAYLLALPMSRRRWLLSHVAASALALAALMAASVAAIVIDALAHGISVPVGAVVARTFLEFVAAAVWIGPMTALMVIARRPIIGVTLAFTALAMTPTSRFALQVPVRPSAARLPALDPWAFADPRAWSGVIPLASLATAITIGVGGTLAALWLFDRLEP